MAIKPLTLTSLSADQLHANNLLCGRQVAFNSQIHDQPVSITLSPSTGTPLVDIHLTLRIEGVDTHIQLSRSLFSEITLGKTPVANVMEQLSEPLLMGSIHLIFDRLIKDLKSLLQKDIQLIKVSFSTEPAPPFWSVIFDLNGKKHIGTLSVNTQNKTWIEAIGHTGLTAFAQLPVLLTLEAGRTFLSSNRVDQLRTEDIILFDHNWYQNGQHVFVRTTSNHGFMAKFDNGQITLTEQMEVPVGNTADNDLDDFDDDLDDDLEDDLDNVLGADSADDEKSESTNATQQTQPTANAPDLKNVPVQLTFDLGQQEIPLGNISQLVPGFTFQLNRAIASPVVINTNGKPFAEGELVDVNGQLGTRITKIL